MSKHPAKLYIVQAAVQLLWLPCCVVVCPAVQVKLTSCQHQTAAALQPGSGQPHGSGWRLQPQQAQALLRVVEAAVVAAQTPARQSRAHGLVASWVAQSMGVGPGSCSHTEDTLRCHCGGMPKGVPQACSNVQQAGCTGLGIMPVAAVTVPVTLLCPGCLTCPLSLGCQHQHSSWGSPRLACWQPFCCRLLLCPTCQQA